MQRTNKLQISVWSLIKDSFRYYPQSFAASFIFVVLAAAIQSGYYTATQYSPVAKSSWILLVVVILLCIYYWVAAIVAVNQKLSINSSSVAENFRLGLKKYPRVLCFLIIYVATYILMTLWLRLLIYVGAHYPAVGHYQGIINLFLAGLPLLLLLVLFLLALPLIVIEQISVFHAFKNSIRLAWRSRLGAVFMMFFLFMVLIYLVMPKSHHIKWLRHYNLDGVVIFLILLLVVPLLINYLVLITRRLIFDRK